MQILYECRGITLADTGEGYAIFKRGQVYIDNIETPREAVILFTEILQTEMLRRWSGMSKRKKQSCDELCLLQKRYLIGSKLPLLLYRQTAEKARRHAPLQTW